MQVICAVSGLYGDYGTVRQGQLFECPDHIAVLLLKAEKVRRPDPPQVLYEKVLRNEGDRPGGEQEAQAPKVTALCLTRNRRRWLPQAIRCFEAQSYPERELLIVSDGEDVRDLVPDDPRIRLLHIEEYYTIGQKRNFAASQARGEILVTWDDDDHSAPGRIGDQVNRLNESGLAVTGYRQMYFTDGANWWEWKSMLQVLGTSLCFRKSWWQAHPFPPLPTGEDGAFVKPAYDAKQLIAAPAGTLMVASKHNGNTCPRSVSNGSYAPVKRPEGIRSPCP